jgi:hypothetical protein
MVSRYGQLDEPGASSFSSTFDAFLLLPTDISPFVDEIAGIGSADVIVLYGSDEKSAVAGDDDGTAAHDGDEKY